MEIVVPEKKMEGNKDLEQGSSRIW